MGILMVLGLHTWPDMVHLNTGCSVRTYSGFSIYLLYTEYCGPMWFTLEENENRKKQRMASWRKKSKKNQKCFPFYKLGLWWEDPRKNRKSLTSMSLFKVFQRSLQQTYRSALVSHLKGKGRSGDRGYNLKSTHKSTHRWQAASGEIPTSIQLLKVAQLAHTSLGHTILCEKPFIGSGNRGGPLPHNSTMQHHRSGWRMRRACWRFMLFATLMQSCAP